MDQERPIPAVGSPSLARFCAGCGSPFRDGDRFCKGCGRPRSERAAGRAAGPAPDTAAGSVPSLAPVAWSQVVQGAVGDVALAHATGRFPAGQAIRRSLLGPCLVVCAVLDVLVGVVLEVPLPAAARAVVAVSVAMAAGRLSIAGDAVRRAAPVVGVVVVMAALASVVWGAAALPEGSGSGVAVSSVLAGASVVAATARLVLDVRRQVS